MKHVTRVKAVQIGGKMYTNPMYAAKRWVEEASRDIMYASYRRHPGDSVRQLRAWRWQQKHWVTGKSKRWRRVLPIFERLLS